MSNSRFAHRFRFSNAPPTIKPLIDLGNCGDGRQCLAKARQYAKTHPKKRGFIVADDSKTGGWRFYFVRDGKATSTSAIYCVPEDFAFQDTKAELKQRLAYRREQIGL